MVRRRLASLPREASRCLTYVPTGRPENAGLPVDFVASEPHYLDHLAPVWAQVKNRGGFYVPDHLIDRAGRRGVHAQPLAARPLDGGPLAVASYRDLQQVADAARHLILFEHGVGYSFSTCHPSYAGGRKWRCLVSLFVCPNDYAADRNLQAYPAAHVVKVGCPKLDAWHSSPPKPENRRPVVGVAWHWDCRVAPEARWAFPHYVSTLQALCREYDVLATAHPRAAAAVQPAMEAAGAQWVDDFDVVMEQADVLLNDASSVLYEFASTGRPVVVLNAPWYRRSVDHGLRFWQHADVGVQVDVPQRLLAAVEQALADEPDQQLRRELAVEAAYEAIDGTAAARAAALLDGFPDVLARRRLRPVPAAPKSVRSVKRKGATCGVAYVAMGPLAEASAERSAASLREWHDVPVAVLAAQPLPWADTCVVRPDDDVTARRWKTTLLDWTPYDHTLLLDADTTVVGDMGHGWAALDAGWELALAQDLHPTLAALRSDTPFRADWTATVDLWGTPEVAYHNSGVLFVRRTAATRRLFAAWHEEWTKKRAYDQLALSRALRRVPVRTWLLATAWNTNDAALATHVWHDHHTVERQGHYAGRRR